MASEVLVGTEFGTLFVIEGTSYLVPEETKELDGIYSVFTAPSSSIIYSDAMYQGNFEATIPSAATITGFECTFVGAALGVSTTLSLGLYIDGSLYGFEQEVGFVSNFTPIVVGSPTDLWGCVGITPADINNYLFQLGFISYYNSFPFIGDTLNIDFLSLKVHYELPRKLRGSLPWGMIEEKY